MARIARFKKDEADRIRYTVDYDEWLDDSEEITSAVVTGNVPADNFVVDDEVLIDAAKKVVLFYASGGVADGEYDATILINTSEDQIKEDWVTIVVT